MVDAVFDQGFFLNKAAEVMRNSRSAPDVKVHYPTAPEDEPISCVVVIAPEIAKYHQHFGTLQTPTTELYDGETYQVRMDMHMYARASEPFGADSGKVLIPFEGRQLRKRNPYKGRGEQANYSNSANKLREQVLVSQYGDRLYHCPFTKQYFSSQQQLNEHTRKLTDVADGLKDEHNGKEIIHKGNMDSYEVYSARKLLSAEGIEIAKLRQKTLRERNLVEQERLNANRKDFMDMNSKLCTCLKTRNLKKDLEENLYRASIHKQKAIEDEERAYLTR